MLNHIEVAPPGLIVAVPSTTGSRRQSRVTKKLPKLGFSEDDSLDKSSLQYRLRRAIQKYFARMVNERIEKFIRGDTMLEKDETKEVSAEENTQKFFTKIAERMHMQKISLIKVAGKYVYDSVEDSRDVQMIYAEDFFKGLRKWGFNYSLTEKEDVCQVLKVKDLRGSIMLEMIEKILTALGIKKGLPVINQTFGYETLDIKSFRIINRILAYMKQNDIENFRDVLKGDTLVNQGVNQIKSVSIVDGKGVAHSIEYVLAEELNDTLRKCVIMAEKMSPDRKAVIKFKCKVTKEVSHFVIFKFNSHR
jgi:hypothetical protein